MTASTTTNCIACGAVLKPFIDCISDDRYGCPGVYAIEQCPDCGHMSTTPPLTEADLPELYSTYYPRREVDFDSLEREAALVKRPNAGFYRWLAGTDNQGHYLAEPAQKVLDIGCGSCLSLLEMRNMGVQCWGIEADPNVRTIAGRYGLTVHIGNIHDQPFPDVTFDLIVLNQVIEHVPDPAAMLAAVKGRLSENGRLILAFPNAGSIHRKIWKLRWINWHIPYHQNHFNRQSFRRLAEKAGYSVASVRTITPNLWSLLQLRTARETRAEGLASNTWAHTDAGAKRPSFWRKVRNASISRGVRVAGLAMSFGNRILDGVGLGDSLLVVLVPAGRKE